MLPTPVRIPIFSYCFSCLKRSFINSSSLLLIISDSSLNRDVSIFSAGINLFRTSINTNTPSGSIPSPREDTNTLLHFIFLAAHDARSPPATQVIIATLGIDGSNLMLSISIGSITFVGKMASLINDLSAPTSGFLCSSLSFSIVSFVSS